MAHDRISDKARWRTCMHEAGHVALAVLTKTPLFRANAYRHYSTASFYEAYGYAIHDPDASPLHDSLIEGAGIVAERLFTTASTRSVVRCTDRLPDSDEALEFIFGALTEFADETVRVARLLRDSRGYVSGPALTKTFWEA